MDENINLQEDPEIVGTNDVNPMDEEELKAYIEDKLNQQYTRGLLTGAQSMCKVILDKIYVYYTKPGKKTYRDGERLIKDIKSFCDTGLSRKVNSDGTTSPIEETEE